MCNVISKALEDPFDDKEDNTQIPCFILTVIAYNLVIVQLLVYLARLVKRVGS
jgi:hypothetical protein